MFGVDLQGNLQETDHFGGPKPAFTSFYPQKLAMKHTSGSTPEARHGNSLRNEDELQRELAKFALSRDWYTKGIEL